MLQFVRWITERDYRAALLAAGFVLLPLFAPASCAILALTAMQRGPVAAWRTVAMAAPLLAGVAWASGAQPLAAVLAALTVWVPSVAMAQLLVGSGSLSHVARYATLGAVLLAGAWAALMPVEGEAWRGLVTAMVTPLSAQSGLDPAVLAERVLELLPGMIAASLLLVTLCGLFLAMWLQAGLTSPGAFGEAFRSLQLGPLLGGAAVVSIGAAAATGLPLATVVAMPASTALTIQGIAVMHGLVKIKGLHRAWLLAGWTALVVLSPWALMGFAFYGMADTFMNLRQRAAGRV
jgi:hypothetical protein